MKKLAEVLMVPLLAALLTPASALADGMFVVPKFVWDKHKDINEPTQKAILVYDAGREDLILQVKYEGPVDDFGWLIPVPNLPTVQKGSMKCFYELSQYTQRHFEWGHQNSQTRSIPMSLGVESADKSEPPVKVIEIKTVGAYEIAVLSTKDSSALAKWLDANHFYFPTNKTDVLDTYVKQHWYFVAARINLVKGEGFTLLSPRQFENQVSAKHSTGLKLASGELNPLQISFASDHCVFPLKISSVNGQPSEVQVYVLSPEPLLETTMLEKKLPLIYSNDLARAQKRAQSMKNVRLLQMAYQIHAAGGTVYGPASLPPQSPEDEKRFQNISETPEASPDDLLPYAKVTKADLPNSSKWILRLADKSWWLTKQTWTFKPEEMHDLMFEPALSIFSKKLDSKYGYFAAASFAPFGADAAPALIAAFHSSTPAVRVNAVSAMDDGMLFSDPRVKEAAISWLKDSEPTVRIKAVQVLTDHSNWNPKFAEALVPLLRDEDAEVRYAVTFDMIRLPQFHDDLAKFIPEFRKMLKDTNSVVRVSGLHMMLGMELPIERDDLISFFTVPDLHALGRVAFYLRDKTNDYKISNQEVVPLLQNIEPFARVFGLDILYRNADKQSVELALPLLQDSDELVRLKTAQTLRAMTGQHFTETQNNEWTKWWTENKTNFVVQLHPEELRPQLPGIRAGDVGDRPPPATPPENLPR